MRLVVTGASGLLGINLCLVALGQGHHVTGLSHTRGLVGIPFDLLRVDLADSASALSVIEGAQPEAIIHCAALADMNAAQKAPELAYQVNCEAAGALAKAASRWGIPLIHISTDAVFDGTTGGYREEDPVSPLSFYAQTKLAGEEVVMMMHPDAIIARVVFFGWSISGRRSLSEFFFNNMRDGQQVKGFTDALFSPLYVEDLADVLLEMLSVGLKGVYHVVSPESMSKYDFGVCIAERFGFDSDLIEPIRMQDLARGAPRSSNLALKPGKVQTALGHPLPTVEMGIERLYQRWLEQYPQQLQEFTV
jgi:dTDP-4-dehydrorhamnose reductase